MEAAPQSKLGHFLSIVAAEFNDINVGVFDIQPLRFPLSLEHKTLFDANDLSDIHHHLWKWETSLISVCRDLSLNSAYGRPFCARTLSKEVDDVISASATKELLDQVHSFRTAATHPVGTDAELLAHYRESRELAATLKQIPISNTAIDVAAYNASPMTYMGDGTGTTGTMDTTGTTLALQIAKDVTVRDAFTTSSWYGR